MSSVSPYTPLVLKNSDYYLWIYWWNPLSWAYRALLINEFSSPDYDEIIPSTGERLGNLILEAGGMNYKGEAFGTEWIGYAFAYMVPYAMICTLVQSLCLEFVRVEPKGSPLPPEGDADETDSTDGTDAVEIPFKPVTLTFTDVCYDVKASKGKETLRLLHDVNGIFKAGRMCALMGSSGAGKTTLMVRSYERER